MEQVDERDSSESRGRVLWGLKLLVGGAIVAMGADSWEALRSGIAWAFATMF